MQAERMWLVSTTDSALKGASRGVLVHGIELAAVWACLSRVLGLVGRGQDSGQNRKA